MKVYKIEELTNKLVWWNAALDLQIVANDLSFYVIAHKSGYTVTNPDGGKCQVPKTRDVCYRIKNWKPGQLWA